LYNLKLKSKNIWSSLKIKLYIFTFTSHNSDAVLKFNFKLLRQTSG